MSRWPWHRRTPEQRRMNCMQVARILQAYLDGQADEVTARRVTAHLEDCRCCGLEAAVYREIKHSLSRRETLADEAVARLRVFGEALARGESPGSAGRGHREPPVGA